MSKGRVYRRCACRDEAGKQLGKACPKLAADRKHGQWYYAVDVPTVDGRRKTVRRSRDGGGRFPTKKAAESALSELLKRLGIGVEINDRETVAAFLTGWVGDMRLALKPSTMLNYGRYVNLDIIPAIGAIKLEQLRHNHVQAFRDDLMAAGRGAVTVDRILSTLSSAMSDAVEQRRLPYNPVEHVRRPPAKAVERLPWDAGQFALFFQHAKADRMVYLFETIAGCALRRGEALALRWSDIDLDARALKVRRTLSDVNGALVFTAPKTDGSAASVGLSQRVVEALKAQRALLELERAQWGAEYQDNDLVFPREDGAPLRPKRVLRHFRSITNRARRARQIADYQRAHPELSEAEALEGLKTATMPDPLPEIRVHDLRHGAATMLLAEGVPLAVVSKMLRHTKVSTTVDLYGHLLHDVALNAADAMASSLDAAAAELEAMRTAETTLRPQRPAGAPAGSRSTANPQVSDGGRL
ncbi:tyrosine-type recombinase/integrase [Labedaea rhizosphaerae]|uniref:Site-specific recombinase XerD n=1 Tax=Labedaea rhizosphaerae TaxID=598644 RepID=A0A4R6RWH9_LABRH|nr:site-specific integrase [Labedaea rhizosphaerae]TDP90506.1 site-specific recombinase XerD [Labedaea rhizosphaerae]